MVEAWSGDFTRCITSSRATRAPLSKCRPLPGCVHNDTATVESFGNNVIRGNVGGNNVSGTLATVVLQ